MHHKGILTVNNAIYGSYDKFINMEKNENNPSPTAEIYVTLPLPAPFLHSLSCSPTTHQATTNLLSVTLY